MHYSDNSPLTQLIDGLQGKFSPKHSGTEYRTIWQVLHLDVPLLIGLLVLIVFGLFILYSASSQQWGVIIQRGVHVSIAFLVMFIMAQISPVIYQRWSPWIYAIGVLLLMMVLIVGHISKGAQRWLDFGLFHFQPSEMMKLAIPMCVAWYCANRHLPPKFYELVAIFCMIGVPVFLTLAEPDLGTAVVLALGGACVLLFAGINWKLVLSFIISGVISIPILWHVMHDYQRQRILTFLNPERDPLGAGYHIIQSKIAIGSGGLFGKGWLQGTQANLNFLPEDQTDFIFAVCGEDFGFLGCLLLLAIYLYIVIRCFYIATQAQDTYTRLLSGSLTLMFFVSVFVNIGMVSGILPVVGLPLPLISYGGSSMITIMAGFGLLMSMHRHRTLLRK